MLLSRFSEALHIYVRIMYLCNAGVLKLWISTFLMEFGFLNLEFGNQIWKFGKFMSSYFGKFSFKFSKISNFLEFAFFNELK